MTLKKTTQNSQKKTAQKSAKTKRATAHKKNNTNKKKTSASTQSVIVGIGASAGGLDAFKNFLTAMPADSNLAFVLVQHLDPNHESLMVDLLARHTSMPVLQVEDQMKVQRNHVYMIPPNKSLTIKDGILHLSKPVERRGMRMPIDYFFRSLAEDQQEKAICIIFSGTGTDGTLGLKAVKEYGGMAMVQEPNTAGYDGMPRSAIATDMVDFILPVEQMPEDLIRYVSHSYLNESGKEEPKVATEPDQLNHILAVLRTRGNYDFRAYKKNTLIRRIKRRMGLNNIEDMGDYLKFIRDAPEELKLLAKDMLITVTSFFRDSAAMETLKEQVLPILVERAEADNAEPLRIWVPACATGEEAYSIAIMLMEVFEDRHSVPRIQIFATDVDGDALEYARAGIYPDSIAADVSPERLNKFFTSDGPAYLVNKSLRESVVFAVQNIITDPPFSKLDLISCRNLLIYIDPSVQKKIIPLFHFALRPGGYLFLGPSETIGREFGMFEPISKSMRIYHRIGATQRFNIDFPLVFPDEGLRAMGTALRKPERHADPGEVARDALLEQFAPAAVLVNHKYEILYFYGPTSDYLELPTGEPVHDLMMMVRQGLRTKLRGAVHRAIAENKSISVHAHHVRSTQGNISVIITVLPVQSTTDSLLLVTFRDEPEREVKSSELGSDEVGETAMVQQLEYELHVTREDLQSTIEEMETSNEELKAANEEVMSMNEELQSTNEELETSKEELQSLNEELNTVNNQLQDKVTELEVTNNDLNNLFTSTDIATVFLDGNLCIKRFTPSSSKLLSLIPTDIGRPLSDIAYKVEDEHLIEEAIEVLTRFIPQEREVTNDDGHWYLRRIIPYRTEDNKIEGVVLTFANISRVKKAEQQVQRLNRLLRTITEIDRVMVQEQDEKALLEQACHILVEHGGYLMAWVGKADVESGEVIPIAHAGMTADYLQKINVRCDDTPQGQVPIGMAIRTGKYQITDNVDGDGYYALWRQQAYQMGYRSCGAFPLKVYNKVIGAISVYEPETNAFDYEKTTLLSELADTIGFALQNYQEAEQRRQAEAALRQSEASLAEAQHIARVGSWQLDLDTNTLQWSDEVYRIFDIKPDEFSPTYENFLQSVHPDDRQLVKEAYSGSLDNQTPYDIVHRVISKQGDVRYVHEKCQTAYDQNGKPLSSIGTVQDMTELKQAELELKKYQDELEHLVAERTEELQKEVAERKYQQRIIERTAVEEATLAAILRLGLQRLSLQEMLGQSVTQLMDHVPWLDLTSEAAIFLMEENNGATILKRVADCNLPPEQEVLCSNVPLGTCLCGTAAKDACVLFANSEDERHVFNFDCMKKHSHYCLPIVIEGNTAGILLLHSTFEHENDPSIEDFLRRLVDVISMSISRHNVEKQLIEAKQEAERANNAKTEFLSSMSHELRTPLNAILGFGQLLKFNKNNLSAEDQESLDYILSSGKHLLNLINEVLDLAKVDAGKLDITIKDVNVSDILEKCIQFVKPLTLQPDINIRRQWNDVYWVKADATRLTQVLLNLLMNAVKYNRQGGVVTIDVESIDGDKIRISITDTGIGIKPEERSKLFEPFQRLDNLKDLTSGTGIGLNITQKLTELMGGTVDFVSQQGKGSTFWIELSKGTPVKIADRKMDGEVKSKAAISAQKSNAVQKILYIEDDPDNLVLMQRAIRKLSDYELLTADMAITGLELAVKHKPDLIILDINLPGIDGFEALKTLQKDPETQHIPVFALSASAMPEQIKKGYEAGFSAYLTKPIEINKLLGAINKVQPGIVGNHDMEKNTDREKAPDLTAE
jgi:PAS domain S-box-containing protein